MCFGGGNAPDPPPVYTPLPTPTLGIAKVRGRKNRFDLASGLAALAIPLLSPAVGAPPAPSGGAAAPSGSATGSGLNA
jgi:hypothetical protein